MLEKIGSNRVKMTVTVDAETFEKGMQTAYRKNVSRINIPGFRKGKAPRRVLENYYGEAILYEDAFDEVFPIAYQAMVDAEGITPVAQPEIDIEQIESGKDLIVNVEVYVRPEVTLGDYTTIEVTKRAYPVTQEEVDAELAAAQERVSRWVDVEREAKIGDRVTVDYAGEIDGVPFEGGTAQNTPITIGANTFIPGFEEQLIGLKVGDHSHINVTFPEDYRAEDLAGKPAMFHISVHGIQEKELPALDDEFAKDVSEYDSLADYTDSIRKRLEEAAQNRAQNEMDEELFEKLGALSPIDIPEPMVERQVDNMINDMSMRMSYQGISLNDFMRFTGQSIDDMREQYHAEAHKRLNIDLLMDAVTKEQDMESDDETVEKEIEELAKQVGREVEEVKKDFTDEDWQYMKDRAAARKTIEYLRSKVKFVDEVKEEEKKPAKSTRKTTKKAAAEPAADAAAPSEEEGEKKPKRTRKAPAKKQAPAEGDVQE